MEHRWLNGHHQEPERVSFFLLTENSSSVHVSCKWSLDCQQMKIYCESIVRCSKARTHKSAVKYTAPAASTLSSFFAQEAAQDLILISWHRRITSSKDCCERQCSKSLSLSFSHSIFFQYGKLQQNSLVVKKILNEYFAKHNKLTPTIKTEYLFYIAECLVII